MGGDFPKTYKKFRLHIKFYIVSIVPQILNTTYFLLGVLNVIHVMSYIVHKKKTQFDFCTSLNRTQYLYIMHSIVKKSIKTFKICLGF